MSEWRAAVGYEGFIEVSDEGEVRSVARAVVTPSGRSWTMRGRVLGQSPNRHGYASVRITINGKSTRRRVAYLVAETFLPQPEDGQILRHLDDDRMNSRLSNLAYGTHSDNAQDRVRNGRDANASKTHCPKGHLLDGKRKSGGRYCKQCSRENALSHYYRNR